MTEIAVSVLTDRMTWICADTLTEVYVAVVVVVMVAFGGIAPVSCDPKVWSGVAFASDLSLTANVDASAWVTLMAVLKSTIFLSPLEELLLFCWIAFRC